MLKNLLNDKRLTTASLLKREYGNNNYKASDLNGELLKNFYGSLKPVTPPDFSNIGTILEKLIIPDQRNMLLSGVIVETRRHKNIKLVVDNFFQNLDCPLVFCFGQNNREYVMDHIGQEFRQNVVLQELNCEKIDAQTYNAIFLSAQFWRALASKGKILTIQTDSWISKFSDFIIEDFMEFDFIGSAYSRLRPIGIIADGGNGGLSLRDWHKSVACIKKFNPKYWRGGEDGYFNFHIDLLGGKVADFGSCLKFGTQSIHAYNSWGFHQPSLLPLEIQREVMRKEPDLAEIATSSS